MGQIKTHKNIVKLSPTWVSNWSECYEQEEI